MAENLISCRDLSHSLIEYLDGAMSPPLLERFEEHVAYCDDCLVHIERLRTVATLVRALPRARIPDRTRDAILALARR